MTASGSCWVFLLLLNFLLPRVCVYSANYYGLYQVSIQPSYTDVVWSDMANKVTLLVKDSYLAYIKNSVGSNAFRNLYAKVGKSKKDILRDGDLSCAFFVSAMLIQFALIEKPHATVEGLERDIKKSGWKKIKRPKIGSIIFWRKGLQKGEEHRHVGFYIGKNKAVSNSDKKRQPANHHYTFGKVGGKAKRKMDSIYWHKKLDS